MAAIPFTFFASLLQAIASVKPKKVGSKNDTRKTPAVLQTLKRWIEEVHKRYSPLPPSTTEVFFRLLFPEEDVSRKYGIQEAKLAQYLAKILAVSTERDGRGRALVDWKAENTVGCLGAEVRNLMEQTYMVTDCTTSMAEVDALLTELASTCAFSSSKIRSSVPSSRAPRVILRELYSILDPLSASFVTQIILKDLRPLMYPLSETHYTASLLQYKSNAAFVITKECAMRAWDPSGRMYNAYSVRASLEEASRVYEDCDEDIKPQVGIPINIPKCIKGQSCSHALNYLKNSEKVWAETKYDGERTQIHVEVRPDGTSKITIFSKSGRNSTWDRFAIHSVIREALCLPLENSEMPSSSVPRMCKVKQNIILEAEMVAFSEPLDRVDEFWRIRSLVTTTALGVRHVSPAPRIESESQETDSSQASMASNASDGGTRRLALVFFDILLLDSVSLLHRSYSQRRDILESLVTLRPGYTMLAHRTAIPMSSSIDSEHMLRRVFAAAIADHQEGVVLKANESTYNAKNLPWIKLKKDYIPGYGDAIDLVLLGASWEKDRARELRVAPTAYTTFYIGALANAEVLKTMPSVKPHFEIIFTVSYGLPRERLEELNFRIKSSDPVECLPHSRQPPTTPYSYNICHGLPLPTVMMSNPICVELYGAGFTKPPRSRYYELRFPRILKVFRPDERPWNDASTLQDLQQTAYEVVGRDRSGKAEDDWCTELWGKTASPGIKSASKRKAREEEWIEKLEDADGKPKMKAQKLDFVAGSSRDNMKIGRQEDPKTPPRSKALGSVTNLLSPPASSPLAGNTDMRSLGGLQPSYILQVQSPAPSSSPRPPAKDIVWHRSPSMPTRRRTSEATPKKIAEQRSCDSVEQPHDHLLPDIAGEFSSTNSLGHQPLTPTSSPLSGLRVSYMHTDLAKFLWKGVVWLSKPSTSSRPAGRASASQVVPNGRQVHSLDALLVACGWTNPGNQPCSWAEYGVVFVDDTDSSSPYQWMDFPLKRLMEGRRMVIENPNQHIQCIPIWVFSLKMFNISELEMDAGVDVARRALCRLG